MRLLLILAVLFSMDAHAYEHGCLSRHFREASEINAERGVLYANLSHGQSTSISKDLIRSEKEMSILSQLPDLLAYPFQEEGVPLFCRELVSMRNVPLFYEHIEKPWPELRQYKHLDLSAYIKNVKILLEYRDFTEIRQETEQLLAHINKQPHFYCMQRHFIETVARAAAIASEQNELALKKGLVETLSLSTFFIRSTLSALTFVGQLDDRAAPIQAAGIPFLCQDVPRVWPENF